MKLDARKQTLLRLITEFFLETGEPVGSKLICEKLNFTVSSATIRNEMSELSELGLLEQPHTSAGRIPSEVGLRIYLNHLLIQSNLPEERKQYIHRVIGSFPEDPLRMLGETADLLAELTGLTAFAAPPVNPGETILNLQLIPVGSHSLLAVAKTGNGMVESRFCNLDFELTPAIHRVFTRIASAHISGLPLTEITPAFIQTLAVGLGDLTFFMAPVLLCILELSESLSTPPIQHGGLLNLVFCEDISRGARRLAAKLLSEERGGFRNLFADSDSKTSVRLGAEIGLPELTELAFVSSVYRLGNSKGFTGVTGPLRLSYAQVIPTVEYVSTCVEKQLTINN